jgi:hypothetical protein
MTSPGSRPMTETGTWRSSRVRAARRSRVRATEHRPAVARGDGSSSSGRADPRLWALLHAQALLQGTAGGAADPAFVEDDRRRLAAWSR